MKKLRSQSKQRIIDVAFRCFVLNGYEGASLGAIAENIGIRKASIYTHFKSKDSLFLELLLDALDIECSYLEECFNTSVSGKLPGELYLGKIKSRYENAITYQFLTRIAYVPPNHLIENVKSAYQDYIQQIIQFYQAELSQIIDDDKDQEMYTDAYLGILDSLSVELLYDGHMYERRLNAMLCLYKQSIEKIIK
ncbi:MAG: TetR/AcrR family transcriptional regulator [Pedobacter sp.]|uniref:TetR/AcrR family transcriptional regulator n=1 Tax=Acinetobacter TaxID=469 RepID=UPI00103F4AB9|nr:MULTISPECIES: TetR/AcrR family transcriptional regulator [Acinetobacter Taxon 24]MBP8067664.1 TetR/AcrR family transcriptional regulator [Pedobacter sp.]NNH35973.1 TetR/AcrR family transcriptional regulator [Acinetobacter terrestris]TCH60715.1 TetR/AcrR family transcriptional regulator [Acinetobacter sp. ANC 4862]